MSRSMLVGLVFALATACTTQQNGGGGADGNTAGHEVTPKVGAWNYAQITPTSNTCNSNLTVTQGGNFAIDAANSTSFHVTPNDGSEPFTCTLSATGAFDCPNRAAATKDERPMIDAVITVHATASGQFSDSTHATGGQHATVDCAGTQCALIGPTPCSFAQSFSIVAL